MAVKVELANGTDETIAEARDIQIKDGHLIVTGYVNDPTLAIYAPEYWISATADSAAQLKATAAS